MASVFVKKNKTNSEVIEKSDYEEKIIFVGAHDAAKKIVKLMKSGGGFAGFTPSFILNKVKV